VLSGLGLLCIFSPYIASLSLCRLESGSKISSLCPVLSSYISSYKFSFPFVELCGIVNSSGNEDGCKYICSLL
jgi:hypothetical protein